MSAPFGRLRSFTARFPGICEECGGGFEQGDEVAYSASNDLVHGDPDDCWDSRLGQARSPSAPCGKCFLVHAGDCF